MLNHRSTKAAMITSAVVFALAMMMVATADANHAPVSSGNQITGHAAPRDDSPIEIVTEDLTVRFEKNDEKGSKSLRMPKALVTASYTLRNPTPNPQHLDLAFPRSGSPHVPAMWEETTTQPAELFEVTLDGHPLNVKEEKLESFNILAQRFDREARLHQLFDTWVSTDPKIKGLVEQIESKSENQEYVKRWNAVGEIARKELQNQGLGSYFAEYAENPADFSIQCVLIAEVDPAWRVASQIPGIPYEPKIHESKQADFKSHSAEFRKKIDEWIQARPALSAACASLREVCDRRKNEQRATDAEAALKLHMKSFHHFTETQTDLFVKAETAIDSDFCWVKYDVRSYDRAKCVDIPGPPIELLKVVLPDQSSEIAKLESSTYKDPIPESFYQWGFDDQFISTLTGRLYQKRNCYWDDSMNSMVPHVLTPEDKDAVPLPIAPRLMRYSIDIPAKSNVNVTVKYLEITNYDNVLYMSSQTLPIPQFSYILRTVKHWKSVGPIHIRIETPNEWRAVVLPEPTETTKDQSNTVIQTMTLINPKDNLHIALIDIPTFSDYRFETRFNQSEIDTLKLLISGVKNPVANRLLRCIAASKLMYKKHPEEPDRRPEAIELLKSVEKEDPDFSWGKMVPR